MAVEASLCDQQKLAEGLRNYTRGKRLEARALDRCVALQLGRGGCYLKRAICRLRRVVVDVATTDKSA